MDKTIFSIIQIIIIIAILISVRSCGRSDPSESTPDPIDIRAAAVTVGNYILSESQNGAITNHDFLRLEDLLELAGESSDVYKAFRNAYFEYAFLADDNTVIICSDTIFQSAAGYIVTDGSEITSEQLAVLGYDGDVVNITRKYENYENLYSWSAGL